MAPHKCQRLVSELLHGNSNAMSKRQKNAAARYAPVAPWMRDAKRWLLWKSQSRGSGKPQKVPYYVNGAVRGTTDTSVDWALLATFADACAALDANPDRYAGLGFALGPDGTGNVWQGIDLDDFNSRPSFCQLVSQFPGYVELSPSGNGFHVLSDAECHSEH